jgi:hypothetical protein
MIVNPNRHGYAHPDYAASLSEFGTPIHLERADAWILKRSIPDSAYVDAMGTYPLLFCGDWRSLGEDLTNLPPEIVSFAAVTDPFAACDERLLQSMFHIVKPFKEHFVTDLELPVERIVSKSHQQNVRRALRNVNVDVCNRPEDFIREWLTLFSNLVERHQIRGMKAFSHKAFETQFRIPGLVMFRATERGTEDVLGHDLWYEQGDVAYGHLVAFSQKGYSLRATYATKWHVLDYFRGRVHFLHLGAVAGTDAAHPASQGLAHFKNGWATGRKQNYFCGRILDMSAYAELSGTNAVDQSSYFPAYRVDEFH